MSVKKVFLTGGGGLLGQYLNISLSQKYDLLSIYNNNPGNALSFNSLKLDLKNKESVAKIFKEFSPDIVIHTAAVSRPEVVETMNHKEVYEINVGITKHLAELCRDSGAKLIYTSTDLVYAGYRGSMLTEESKIIPISLYAETKLMGEVKIRETFENHIILRTCLLFGMGMNHSSNNFHKMYFALKEGRKVNLFTDQYRTPLSLTEAARIIAELASTDAKNLTLNFGGKERVSRFELGEILCEEGGFEKKYLNPVKMDDIPGTYKVADVSLNCSKLENLGIKRLSIRESVQQVINRI